MEAERTGSLARFYEVTGIPLTILGDGGEVIIMFPYGEPMFCPSFFGAELLAAYNKHSQNAQTPVVVTLCDYFMFGAVKREGSGYLVIGPISVIPAKREDIRALAIDRVFPERFNEFYNIMFHAPVMTSRQFLGALSVCVQLLTGESIPTSNIPISQNPLVSELLQPGISENLFVQREHAIMHTPYSFEMGVLAAVEAGDVEMLTRRLMEPVSGHVGSMSHKPLTQEKYTFVAFVTLVSRAAIRGGMDYEAACMLSDAYCQQMDNCANISDVNALSAKMPMDFCKSVGEEKAKNLSPLTQKMRNYISAHIHENIFLGDIAEYCGISGRSASQHFKKETGQTIPESVHEQKAKAAAHMLIHSSYSLADVAAIFQYSSQSYFTKTFKEVYKMTPQRYRDIYKKTT